MFWVILALTGAITNAGYFVVTKKLLQSINPYVLAAGSFLITAFFLLFVSLLSGIPVIGDRFFFAVSITAGLNIIATILVYQALATTDISLAIPMLSFTPVFLIGTSLLILHELPTMGGAVGILIIVSGSYVLNLAPGQKSIVDPVRSIAKHPGILYMLVVAFLYSVSVNFDKMAVQESDTYFGSAVVFLVIGFAFILIALFFCRDTGILCGKEKDLPSQAEPKPAFPGFGYRTIAAGFIFIGLLITIEAIVINYAYTMQIVPYVIAFKRMSIVITVIFGAVVFHESDLCRRLAGAALMVLGAVLILLTL